MPWLSIGKRSTTPSTRLSSTRTGTPVGMCVLLTEHACWLSDWESAHDSDATSILRTSHRSLRMIGGLRGSGNGTVSVSETSQRTPRRAFLRRRGAEEVSMSVIACYQQPDPKISQFRRSWCLILICGSIGDSSYAVGALRYLQR